MSIEDDKDKIERLIIPRHTYTESNAKRFLDTINKCLELKTDEFISCENAGLAVTSLKQRLNEAFLWLTHSDTKLPKDCLHSKEEYRKLRSSIKLTPVSYGGKVGIMLNFQKYKSRPKAPPKLRNVSSTSITPAEDSIPDNQEIKLHWRDRVINYLTDDNQKMLILDTPEDFNHKPLDDLDVEWLTKTFTSAGLEFEVDVMTIKSVK